MLSSINTQVQKNENIHKTYQELLLSIGGIIADIFMIVENKDTASLPTSINPGTFIIRIRVCNIM